MSSPSLAQRTQAYTLHSYYHGVDMQFDGNTASTDRLAKDLIVPAGVCMRAWVRVYVWCVCVCVCVCVLGCVGA